MKRTKRALSFLLMTVAMTLGKFSFGGELKSLQILKHEFHSTNDQTKVYYILCRCSALNLTLGALLSKTSPDISNGNLINKAADYLKLANMIRRDIELDRGVKKRDDERVIDSNNIINGIGSIYAKTMNENYAKSGNYFSDDKELMAEIGICKDLEKTVQWLNSN